LAYIPVVDHMGVTYNHFEIIGPQSHRIW